MPISLTPTFSEIREDQPIPVETRAYFRGGLRNQLHELILKEFVRQERAGFTRAKLARRIEKGADQITRLLGAPGNWTLDTVSDLLLGMGVALRLAIVRPADQAQPEGTVPVESLSEGSRHGFIIPFGDLEGRNPPSDLFVGHMTTADAAHA